MGTLGMSFSEVCKLTPEEVEAADKNRQSVLKADWERTRLLAYASLAPHMGKHKKSAKELIPLPWDADVAEESSKIPDRETARKRFEELVKHRRNGQ